MRLLALIPGRPLGWLPVLALAGVLGNALRLRARARALPLLAPPEPASPEGPPADGHGYSWLLAEGVTPDTPTRAALEAYAGRAGLRVVEAIPRDLPLPAALEFLRTVDPATYTTSRLAPGRSTGQAVLAGNDLLERAGLAPAPGMDPVALMASAARLKKYAPAATGFVVAPSLRAGTVGSRRAGLSALGIPLPLAMTGPLASYAVLAAGVAANPLWGVAALAAWSLQPYLIFGGTPLRPRGLRAASLGRIAWDPIQTARLAFGPKGAYAEAQAAEREARLAAARERYAVDIAAGVDRYLEPRRETCPWCGSDRLTVALSTPDLLQGKPGTFTLERCGACGHVFQNPRLTPAGLEFYYRDFYDGCGENALEVIFGTRPQVYRDRAEILRPHLPHPPARWLDVGTGHGHFCNVARDAWPQTSFDGLEMAESIEEAERQGWVDRAFRGLFPDLAHALAERYEVVTMSHYLEHTRDPFAELDAAAAVLSPGGHLMIEVPDPEWRMGRLLKRFWLPWLQPQHQHLIPIDNLEAALRERGLVPIARQRDTAACAFDLTGALSLALAPATRALDAPWAARRPGAGRRVLKGALTVMEVPLFIGTAIADWLLSLVLRRSGTSTAYRVVARKASGVDAAPGSQPAVAAAGEA